jgi:hypothetical protein
MVAPLSAIDTEVPNPPKLLKPVLLNGVSFAVWANAQPPPQ